jgi:hypothetical protein
MGQISICTLSSSQLTLLRNFSEGALHAGLANQFLLSLIRDFDAIVQWQGSACGRVVPERCVIEIGRGLISGRSPAMSPDDKKASAHDGDIGHVKYTRSNRAYSEVKKISGVSESPSVDEIADPTGDYKG